MAKDICLQAMFQILAYFGKIFILTKGTFDITENEGIWKIKFETKFCGLFIFNDKNLLWLKLHVFLRKKPFIATWVTCFGSTRTNFIFSIQASDLKK